MAIKPIQRYGIFQPTSVDTSAAQTMRALAGVGQALSEGATAIGKPIAEREAIKEAEVDVAKAREEGTEIEMKSPLAWGGSTYNQVAKVGYLAGMQNALTNAVANAEKEFPNDYQAFASKVEGAVSGFVKNMPLDWQEEIADYASNITNAAGKRILSLQAEQASDANLADFNVAQDDRNNFELNLAYEGDLEGLYKESLKSQEYAEAGVKAGFLKSANVANNRLAQNKRIRANIVSGKFKRATINDDSKTVLEKIAAAENIIASIQKQPRLKVENHLEPGEFVLVSAEEKDNIVESLQADLKQFADAEMKRQENKTLYDKLQQTQNYRGLQDLVRNDTLSDEQKIADVRKAEMANEIGAKQAETLRGYINSVKALNAVTNASDFGNIISQVYDLNAELDLSEEGDDYLTGLSNIDDQIMELRANGKLSVQDEKKIRSQIDNLVNAKKSKATIVIRENWYEATRILQNNLPPELVGVATRDLFEEVEAEKQRLIDAGMSIEAKNEMELWKRLAPKVTQSVIDRERSKAFGKLSGEAPELDAEDQAILDKYIRNQ